MPSRNIPPSLPPSPRPPPHPHHRESRIIAGGVAAAFSLLFALTLCFHKLSRKRTVPSPDSKAPHRFSYSTFRRATSSFSPSNPLGQGGFGSVYCGTLTDTNQFVAVKLMDADSLQGEREFQNELFFAGKIDCNQILSVVGFSSDKKRRRMLLVYELMPNGSLQDCLLHRKCKELMVLSSTAPEFQPRHLPSSSAATSAPASSPLSLPARQLQSRSAVHSHSSSDLHLFVKSLQIQA